MHTILNSAALFLTLWGFLGFYMWYLFVKYVVRDVRLYDLLMLLVCILLGPITIPISLIAEIIILIRVSKLFNVVFFTIKN